MKTELIDVQFGLYRNEIPLNLTASIATPQKKKEKKETTTRKKNTRISKALKTYHVPSTENDRPRPDMAASTTSCCIKSIATRFKMHVGTQTIEKHQGKIKLSKKKSPAVNSSAPSTAASS